MEDQRKKRAASPSAEKPPASRRKENSSEESNISGGTSASHTTSTSNITQATTVSISAPEERKEMEDSQDFSDYYAGLLGNPRLLARSSRTAWIRPKISDEDGVRDAYKVVSVVKNHPLAAKLQSGLRNRILAVMSTMTPRVWISIDYVRIGYDEENESNNPVVIFITVEKNNLPSTEAQRVVDEIYRECLEDDLNYVCVEIAEGKRGRFVGWDQLVEPLVDMTPYPHAGASIAVSRACSDIKTGCGTLGGYISVDGTAYGLTNHHVVLGKRFETFPRDDEVAKAKKVPIDQPAQKDLEIRIEEIQNTINFITKELNEGVRFNSQILQNQLSSLKSQLKNFETLTPKNSTIGSVWKTSGITVGSPEVSGHRHRMDWALIELETSDRCPDLKQFMNKLPSYFLRSISNPRYLSRAMELVSEKKTLDDMPKYLKRGLTWEETLNKRDASNHYVVWKHGRTSHFTYGIGSDVHSDYRTEGPDGEMITEEWMIKDDKQKRCFSDKGDSGSFVWDTDGFVVGMLWGGKEESFATYVTPIEHLLRDIQSRSGAKEVKLIVRPEDETGHTFNSLVNAAAGFREGDIEFSGGLSLCDEDGTGFVEALKAIE